MDDHFGKYLRLFGTLLFTFLGFIVGIALLMLAMRLFFGVLSYIPWLTYLYILFIVIFPATLFITVYIIYFRRTKTHPSKIIRTVSYIIFSLALLSWLYYFVTDLIAFFKHFYTSIDRYDTYNLLFLSINVGLIFFVGIIQAFTTEKEKDWMERRT